MNIDKIKMPIEKAREEWKKYAALLKNKKEKYLVDMKRAMHELKQGRELIDIYKVFEETGLNKEYEPKIAIARADWKTVHFQKKDTGRGFFSESNSSWYKKSKGDVDLPPETFMHYLRKDNSSSMEWNILNAELTTAVPIIPAHCYPEDDLKNYYVLWEVKKWKTVPEKDDPILLKRLTENLFVILAVWDVTDLEQSIIRGETKMRE